MAKKKQTLINKKTGKEFQTSDPDKVLKNYPKTFRTAPAPTLSNDIEVKEAEIVEKSSTTNKKDDKKNTDKSN